MLLVIEGELRSELRDGRDNVMRTSPNYFNMARSIDVHGTFELA